MAETLGSGVYPLQSYQFAEGLKAQISSDQLKQLNLYEELVSGKLDEGETDYWEHTAPGAEYDDWFLNLSENISKLGGWAPANIGPVQLKPFGILDSPIGQLWLNSINAVRMDELLLVHGDAAAAWQQWKDYMTNYLDIGKPLLASFGIAAGGATGTAAGAVAGALPSSEKGDQRMKQIGIANGMVTGAQIIQGGYNTFKNKVNQFFQNAMDEFLGEDDGMFLAYVPDEGAPNGGIPVNEEGENYAYLDDVAQGGLQPLTERARNLIQRLDFQDRLDLFTGQVEWNQDLQQLDFPSGNIVPVGDITLADVMQFVEENIRDVDRDLYEQAGDRMFPPQIASLIRLGAPQVNVPPAMEGTYGDLVRDRIEAQARADASLLEAELLESSLNLDIGPDPDVDVLSTPVLTTGESRIIDEDAPYFDDGTTFYDAQGEVEPRFYDAQGEPRFYDAQGETEPTFHDAEGETEPTFHDTEGDIQGRAQSKDEFSNLMEKYELYEERLEFLRANPINPRHRLREENSRYFLRPRPARTTDAPMRRRRRRENMHKQGAGIPPSPDRRAAIEPTAADIRQMEEQEALAAEQAAWEAEQRPAPGELFQTPRVRFDNVEDVDFTIDFNAVMDLGDLDLTPTFQNNMERRLNTLAAPGGSMRRFQASIDENFLYDWNESPLVQFNFNSQEDEARFNEYFHGDRMTMAAIRVGHLMLQRLHEALEITELDFRINIDGLTQDQFDHRYLSSYNEIIQLAREIIRNSDPELRNFGSMNLFTRLEVWLDELEEFFDNPTLTTIFDRNIYDAMSDQIAAIFENHTNVRHLREYAFREWGIRHG